MQRTYYGDCSPLTKKQRAKTFKNFLEFCKDENNIHRYINRKFANVTPKSYGGRTIKSNFKDGRKFICTKVDIC